MSINIGGGEVKELKPRILVLGVEVLVEMLLMR